MLRTLSCAWLAAAVLLVSRPAPAQAPAANREAALAAEALSGGRFEQALELCRRAIDGERRLAHRRQLIAKVVLCYQALGQAELAGETFLLLVRDDPTTAHFGCIPLAWLPEQASPALERSARAWLAREDLPAAVLLGASHLLSGPNRALALDRLGRLAAGTDRVVPLLAQAQIWRTQTATVDAAKLPHWEEVIARMPEAARAGPYYLLGQALARHGRWEDAALALLRAPILYPENRALAARSLVEAGRCLAQQGAPAEASRLFREVLEKYRDTRAAAEAQSRLDELR
jgi:tetratricopeptide (TPR) repeat protein